MPFPTEFEDRLKEILPQRPDGIFGPRAWQSFRINTLKTGVQEAWDALSRAQVDFRKVDFCPYAVLVPKSAARELLKSDLVADGLLYAQGLESILAVMVLDPRPGEHVLDMCAAPGSKTSQIAMLMNNQGTLKANEPVAQRVYKLKSVLRLTGARALLSSVDGRRMRPEGEGFERVLVDAPCSCEGRFTLDEPKSFAYWSVRKIKEMSHKQKGLLLNASRFLKPGGTMVYATCTFAPEENEEVVDWFLRKTGGGFELVPPALNAIKTYPCLSQWQGRSYSFPGGTPLRILPDERMEGFFIAKFTNSHYK
ncbi:MAG: RsmB/NOP family class I SAM-dependent RNA methyltransferase [Candidatus Omnitrophica bacterium]|nr:RsmB/NOP family class I SAM-dependent RNA methyltransferase [Candidatus Omnitrophota bacterium]MDE2008739.1 RsmB/NOP family class I SAM-dependent RNA methyltransferase [Candidatus Omnitrophota bacterium]MDE2215163.1 RsmB/NOP family class I SAM-dependent RNA methyltransferase [Candidatus Omnitrophota bacterium]MDE2232166.1 RsmB/NOP family class I SAM-dependent RNA methyltransferase [Candidatus Omnitrophota bacterium]